MVWELVNELWTTEAERREAWSCSAGDGIAGRARRSRRVQHRARAGQSRCAPGLGQTVATRQMETSSDEQQLARAGSDVSLEALRACRAVGKSDGKTGSTGNACLAEAIAFDPVIRSDRRAPYESGSITARGSA